MARKTVHFIDSVAFWGTLEPERIVMRAMYDHVTQNMTPTQLEELHKLFEWHHEEKDCEQAYNEGEG